MVNLIGIFSYEKSKLNVKKQIFVSLGFIIIISLLCYGISPIIGYQSVAFVLLFSLSFIAIFMEIIPVLITAIVSALIWDLFFIPPKFTLIIHKTEDILMLLMYFVIALLHIGMSYKIRNIQKKSILKEEQEKTLRLYNTILNSLSHEFRTPISTILVAVDNIKFQENNQNKTSIENEFLLEIEEAAYRLNRLVENLLNVSRIDAGVLKTRLEWVNMNEFIQEILSKFQENKIIFIEKNNLPLFKIDTAMLEQILLNIIRNAFKYNKEETILSIETSFENENLIIDLKDNGIGFPKDKIKSIFNKFERLENSPTGGLGLGLSIVKGFVEAHNGSIELKNITLGGAYFKLTFPVPFSYLSAFPNE